MSAPQELITLLPAVLEAGGAIMSVRADVTITVKDDKTPVTEADLRADAILLEAVKKHWPDTTVITEESGRSGENLARFFLIDPLDGTKEFISGRSDFTVNVGYIENGKPIWGIVHAPAHNVTFAGFVGKGAWRIIDGNWESISTRTPPAQGLSAVVSRSHLDPETQNILGDLTIAETVQAGSSLKFCRVAEGAADIYPRVGRTMEWDTAAADAVLRAAGGMVNDLTGKPLQYAKPDFANAGFVALGKAA